MKNEIEIKRSVLLSAIINCIEGVQRDLSMDTDNIENSFCGENKMLILDAQTNIEHALDALRIAVGELSRAHRDLLYAYKIISKAEG